MDAELRTLIDHSKFYKGAVRDVVKLLPPSDDALSTLVAETIAAGDELGFVFTITAAFEAGRRIDAQHLERGAALCGDPLRLGNFAWQMDGDVPGALMTAIKRGGMARLPSHRAFCFTPPAAELECRLTWISPGSKRPSPHWKQRAPSYRAPGADTANSPSSESPCL